MLTQRLSGRCLVGILSAITLCTLSCPSGAQAQNKAVPTNINPVITFAINNVAPIEALDLIFHTAEQRYKIASNTLFDKINAAPPIGMHVEAIPLQEVLRKFFQQAHTPLRFRIEKGGYLIEEAPSTIGNKQAEKLDKAVIAADVSARVVFPDARLKDVHLVNLSPADALKTLFTQAKANGIFYFPTDTKEKVTLSLHDVSLGQAVAQLARSLPADWNVGSSRVGRVYVIGDGFSTVPPPARSAADKPQTITLRLETTNLYDALKALFSQAHVNYKIDPALKQQNVTVTGTASSLDAALRLLLDATPKPQTFKIENGIYSIVPK